jgi:hypothetical protein
MHTLLTHVPVVPNTDSEARPIAVECERADGVVELGVLPQSLLDFVVPDGDRCVGAGGRERVVAVTKKGSAVVRGKGIECVHRMKCQGVHGIHLVDIVHCVPVTLEGIFFGLCCG